MLIQVKKPFRKRAPSRKLINENAGVFGTLLKLVASGQMRPDIEDAVIGMARGYAKENNLPVPTDIRGALKLVEEAHELHMKYISDYGKAMDSERRSRDHFKNIRTVVKGGLELV